MMRGTKTMSVFSRLAGSTLQPVALDCPEPIPDPLTCARRDYKQASEELFEFCYRIQVTGKLPDPRSLTRALVRYRETRTLVAQLECKDLAGTPQRYDAQAFSDLREKPNQLKIA
jgi:hypothetical protein